MKIFVVLTILYWLEIYFDWRGDQGRNQRGAERPAFIKSLPSPQSAWGGI